MTEDTRESISDAHRSNEPNRFRRWRIENGLTQDEVADLTGLSKTMVSRAERGYRGFAPLTKVQIARSLGVSISTLFEAQVLESEEAKGTTSSNQQVKCGQPSACRRPLGHPGPHQYYATELA